MPLRHARTDASRELQAAGDEHVPMRGFSMQYLLLSRRSPVFSHAQRAGQVGSCGLATVSDHRRGPGRGACQQGEVGDTKHNGHSTPRERARKVLQQCVRPKWCVLLLNPQPKKIKERYRCKRKESGGRLCSARRASDGEKAVLLPAAGGVRGGLVPWLRLRRRRGRRPAGQYSKQARAAHAHPVGRALTSEVFVVVWPRA